MQSQYQAYQPEANQNHINQSHHHLPTTQKFQNAYTHLVAKVKHEQPQSSQSKQDPKNGFNLNNPYILRGGLIGVFASVLLSWNAGRYSRLGTFKKRWNFIRKFIMVNKKPNVPSMVTNYHTPILNTVVKNFMCYSGEAGIGKSTHFKNLAFTQSGIRPAIYLSFKAAGKDATFFEDIADQSQFGDCQNFLSELLICTKKINEINKYPYRLWLNALFGQCMFAGAAYGVAVSSLDASYGMAIFGGIGLGYIYFINFIYPLLIQTFRRTCPVIIFDDLNKIEQMNMFPQIVRYLQMLQSQTANVMLISPDEDTWTKLRRQPGMKDRIRVRQVYYDHVYTAQSLLEYIKEDKNYQIYMRYVNGNKLYSKDIVVSLIKQLIGKRQVTLRRFTSILILNDEQDNERLVKVLKDCYDGKISTGEGVQKFTDILYDSQTRTMVANLKSIKRQVKMSIQEFFIELKLLLKKKQLPSDNVIAPHLKAYNIVRDLQSDYVFNGRFMYTVFNMAIQEYQQDMKQFLSGKQNSFIKSPVLKSDNKQQISNTLKSQEVIKQNIAKSPSVEENVKNWNNSNVVSKNQSQSQGQKSDDQVKKDSVKP